MFKPDKEKRKKYSMDGIRRGTVRLFYEEPTPAEGTEIQ